MWLKFASERGVPIYEVLFPKIVKIKSSHIRKWAIIQEGSFNDVMGVVYKDLFLQQFLFTNMLPIRP